MIKKIFIFFAIFLLVFGFLFFNFGKIKEVKAVITQWTEAGGCTTSCTCLSSQSACCTNASRCITPQKSCPDRPNAQSSTDSCQVSCSGCNCGGTGCLGEVGHGGPWCQGGTCSCTITDNKCSYKCVGDYGNCDYIIGDPNPGCECLIPNHSGFAWSENIGWISFNSENCDVNGNEIYEGPAEGAPSGCPTSGTAYPYGVYLPSVDAAGHDPNSGSYVGIFSGYAWSEHIGWISFADFDGDGDVDANDKNIPGSPCAPNCEAKLDLTSDGSACGGTGWVCGWVRALVDGGGWDGWIKLRGTATDGSPYGVQINPVTKEYEGWAWGSDVIGWISFNHLNCDPNNDGLSDGIGNCPPAGTSIPDYKVTTSLPLNSKPTVSNAQIATGPSYCTQTLDSNGIQKGQVGFSWTYTDNEGDDQERYWLQIATDQGFAPASLVINCQIIKQVIVDPNTPTTITSKLVDIVSSGSTELINACNDGGELGSRTLAISYGGTYYWRVASKAATGNTNWSNWAVWDVDGIPGPDSFPTPAHAKPYVDFQWCPSKLAVSQDTRFCSIEDGTNCISTATCVDASSPSPPPSPDVTCYNSTGEVACPVGVPGKGWTWIFTDANPSFSFDKNPLVQFTSTGLKDVTLMVTDADDLSCTTTLTLPVGIEYPLPQWKEIPPF